MGQDGSHLRPDRGPAVAPVPVGRQSELAAIEAFLAGPDSGLRGLLLTGPAGIGKTTLWKAALHRASERGFRVLAARPTEIETQLSFSALVDLFGGLADELLPELPEPQRAALDVALLRASATVAPSPLGISVGVLGLIRAAAARGPVLVAVDDAPWLDAASARALEFAVRRLDDAPVRLLVAQRTTGHHARLPELVAALPAERRELLEVAALGVHETGHLIQQALGLTLRRPALVRIHELSGGNAFYALEVACAIQRRSAADPDEVPIPDSLEDLIRDRIDSMPESGTDIALHAAALSSPTREVLVAALGAERAAGGLEHAVAARVLDTDEGAVRFSHPLIAATIYRRASPVARRAVHRTLADVVREPEERARHVALASSEPSAEVAGTLEAAAGAARARGAPAAAASLAEAAIRLTPPHDVAGRRRRTMAAADHHRAAGDVPRAVATLESLAASTPEVDRAPILVQLGEVLMHTSDRVAAGLAFQQASALVGGDLELRARLEWGLAGVAWLTWTDWRAGERHMSAALEAADALGDPVLLLQVIGHVATWDFALGRGLRRDVVERAAALDGFRDQVPVIEHPDHQMAPILADLGEMETARRRLDQLLTDARRRGEWYSLPWVHLRIAWVELKAGNWGTAERHIEECRASAMQSGQDPALVYVGMAEVELLARRGQVERCRALADHYLQVSVDTGVPHGRRWLRTSLGLLELSLGDSAAAHASLQPAMDLDFPGQEEPAVLRPTVPLAVEALVGLGRLGEADRLLESYEGRARQLDRTVSIADALHCRALLLAARLDLETAVTAAEEAVQRFNSLALTFETARALLVLGEIRRRARQKGAARQAVTRALRTFERLGAERWAERARAELTRTDARRTPGAELTETEQRVAELVAAGRTNREIAGALFMSVHTVEAHLTRIYRTLGVRSRTELARRAVDRGDSTP